MRELDRIDRKILSELSRDASLPVARIAERVGLSQTPCWKRIQKLESAGVITRRVALVDPARLGLALSATVTITAPDHGPDWRARFLEVVGDRPEVTEILRTTGGADFLLRIVVRDIEAFDALYRAVTDHVAIKSWQSHFVVERIKSAAAIPPEPALP